MKLLRAPTISAVVITRNRCDILRPTLQSLLASRQPFEQIVVSDDSTDEATASMLAAEFPNVLHVPGPRRGRSANRNHALRANQSDYAMMCDDDIRLDPGFAGAALALSMTKGAALFFPSLEEQGRAFLPNALDFLGFSTVAYTPEMKQHTAHSQCFIIARKISDRILYDEYVSAYGYEEFDFTYRVAASGFPVVPMPEFVCVHTAPAVNEPFALGADANRLYITFKRHLYIDQKPLQAFRFVATAIPHHLLSSFRQAGFRGLGIAWANVSLAASMLRRYLVGRRTQIR
ncbi:glycosyltransferase family 2 protein [Granulicella paludicola]|uniref:glycosyltransferase family 2 protein n=1 Tax=Granulicella paludicola TaxID=474951 RepID=UPI0021DF61E3|nr:glycosyltransferase family 2 protein [Granulicella paludicola]